jgi:hypothetical protein
MFCSLLGSGRRRAIFFVYALCVLTFTVGASDEGRSYYCQRCGLTRHEGGITWFGIPVRWHVRDYDNEFHRLYIRYVSAQCSHPWRGWTHSRAIPVALWWQVGCGHFPEDLHHDDDLALLTRLKDRSKITAVLTSFNLSRYSERDQAVFAALLELKSVSDADQEKRWWTRHRRLFLPRLEVHRAAHRPAAQAA